MMKAGVVGLVAVVLLTEWALSAGIGKGESRAFMYGAIGIWVFPIVTFVVWLVFGKSAPYDSGPRQESVKEILQDIRDELRRR